MIRIIIIFLVVIFNLSCSQSEYFSKKYNNEALQDDSIELIKDSSSIGFQRIDSDFFHVYVKIKGEKLKFLLDTGSKDFRIRASVARRINYHPASKSERTYVVEAGDTIGEPTDILMESIKLKKRNVIISEKMDSYRWQSQNFEGQAGTELMKYFKVTFDSLNSIVTFDLNADSLLDSHDFFYDTLGFVGLKYEIEGNGRKALLDTAYPYGVGVNEQYNYIALEKEKKLNIRTVTGEFGVTKLISPINLRVANYEFNNEIIRLDPWVSQMRKDVIGVGLFKNVKLILNFPKKEMKIEL